MLSSFAWIKLVGVACIAASLVAVGVSLLLDFSATSKSILTILPSIARLRVSFRRSESVWVKSPRTGWWRGGSCLFAVSSPGRVLGANIFKAPSWKGFGPGNLLINTILWVFGWKLSVDEVWFTVLQDPVFPCNSLSVELSPSVALSPALFCCICLCLWSWEINSGWFVVLRVRLFPGKALFCLKTLLSPTTSVSILLGSAPTVCSIAFDRWGFIDLFSSTIFFKVWSLKLLS